MVPSHGKLHQYYVTSIEARAAAELLLSYLAGADYPIQEREARLKLLTALVAQGPVLIAKRPRLRDDREADRGRRATEPPF